MDTRVSSAEPSESALRILTADPDDDSRAFYRRAFDPHDYRVVEASDGRDALVKALVRVPALVITELRLPVIDGVSLCEILRRDRTTAQVPIVIATRESRPEEIERARQLADAVLTKPTRPQELLKECARLMAKAHTLSGLVKEVCTETSESVAASATVLTVAAELLQGLQAPPSNQRPAVKTHSRYATTTPPAAPPTPACPSCDRPLIYELSYVGGVNQDHSEQWDYFICPTCGGFQYRQRTRRLRRLRADEEDLMRRRRG